MIEIALVAVFSAALGWFCRSWLCRFWLGQAGECLECGGLDEQSAVDLIEAMGVEEIDGIAIGAVYEHFRGDLYIPFGVARHADTNERLVIYQDAQDETWARSVAAWSESVQHDGQRRPRFRRLLGRVRA